MVKNTVQRDEKRVIIYYTFDDEQGSEPSTQHPTPNTQRPTPNTQHPAPNTQHPAPSAQHPAPDRSDHE